MKFHIMYLDLIFDNQFLFYLRGSEAVFVRSCGL